MKLRLASGHFSVAGAELADEVVAVKTDKRSDLLLFAASQIDKSTRLIHSPCDAFIKSAIICLAIANKLLDKQQHGSSHDFIIPWRS